MAVISRRPTPSQNGAKSAAETDAGLPGCDPRRSPMQMVEEGIARAKARRLAILGEIEATTKVGLTDPQLYVALELAASPDGRVHVYGIRKSLDDKHYPLSAKAITKILHRLEDYGLVKQEDELQRNSVGPARQYYRLADREWLLQIIDAELEYRRRLSDQLGVMYGEALEQEAEPQLQH